jgi:hypothetical protein
MRVQSYPRAGLLPITTPAYSPESNGLAEAFVGTFKRDDLGAAELRDAESVLPQLANVRLVKSSPATTKNGGSRGTLGGPR